jgi:hypothetical protein
MTCCALVKKNTPDSLKIVTANEGKGINDMSKIVAMRTISELINLEDKITAIRVLDEVSQNGETQAIQDHALAVRNILSMV